MGDVMVAATYYRVSTEEQGKKGFSLPEQRRECQARAQRLATERGAELQLFEFEDTASGDVLDRPGLDACREFLRNTPAQFFICLDPDRFSRSLFLQLLVTEEIEKRDVQLVFIQHQYEHTAEGKLFYQMRGAISEYEKAKIKERTSRGRRGKLAAGGIPAFVEPWGYVWDKQSKTLRVDEEKAPWVIQVYEWFVNGSTYEGIAKKLGDLGVKPPKRGKTWYRGAIKRILQNSVYVGKQVMNKGNYEGITPLRKVPRAKRKVLSHTIRPEEEWVTVEVPAIVPEELWQRALALFSNRRRLSQRGVGLLSGLCVCGLCGQTVHYARANERRCLRCYGRYPHLRDARPEVRAEKPCTLPHIAANKVETAAWDQVCAWLRDPEELQRERHRQAGQGTNLLIGSRIPVLEKELAAREDEYRRSFALAVKGLAPEGFEENLRHLKAEIAALQKELEAATAQARETERQSAMPDLAHLAANIETALEELDLAERQKVLRMLVHRITIYPDRWGYILR